VDRAVTSSIYESQAHAVASILLLANEPTLLTQNVGVGRNLRCNPKPALFQLFW
jgi:hypothetical protein